MENLLKEITYQEHQNALQLLKDYKHRVPEMTRQNQWFRVVDYDRVTQFSKKHKKRLEDKIQSVKISWSRFVIVFIDMTKDVPGSKIEMKPVYVFVETIRNTPEEIKLAISENL